jgi:Holliday junction resolvase RusA-like endonuclease
MFSKTYTIPLKPIAWKRAGTNFNKRTFYDRQTADKLSTGLYLLQQHDNAPTFHGALKVEIYAYFPIPLRNKSIKENDWFFLKPDADNITKFYYDCITDTKIWQDDAQIAHSICHKLYSHTPQTVITITQL